MWVALLVCVWNVGLKLAKSVVFQRRYGSSADAALLPEREHIIPGKHPSMENKFPDNKTPTYQVCRSGQPEVLALGTGLAWPCCPASCRLRASPSGGGRPCGGGPCKRCPSTALGVRIGGIRPEIGAGRPIPSSPAVVVGTGPRSWLIAPAGGRVQASPRPTAVLESVEARAAAARGMAALMSAAGSAVAPTVPLRGVGARCGAEQRATLVVPIDAQTCATPGPLRMYGDVDRALVHDTGVHAPRTPCDSRPGERSEGSATFSRRTGTPGPASWRCYTTCSGGRTSSTLR